MHIAQDIRKWRAVVKKCNETSGFILCGESLYISYTSDPRYWKSKSDGKCRNYQMATGKVRRLKQRHVTEVCTKFWTAVCTKFWTAVCTKFRTAVCTNFWSKTSTYLRNCSGLSIKFWKAISNLVSWKPTFYLYSYVMLLSRNMILLIQIKIPLSVIDKFVHQAWRNPLDLEIF